MGRESGCKKTGGRGKGAPNKKTTALEHILELENCNLPREILACCMEMPPSDRAAVYLKLMEFIYPKRRASEVSLKTQDPQAKPDSMEDGRVVVYLPENGRG